MDAAICTVDLQLKKLVFAGAKNPLVYIKNNEIYRIKGDNNGIGGAFNYKKEIKFTKHEVEIENNTSCYIFSDGFADQFGGEENKKYNPKRLREKLLEIHRFNFLKQKEILDKEIENWKAGSEQTDDILVIGFSIK